MAFPEKIPVKISSEAAGYVSITPVVAEHMPTAELIEHILRVAGKDVARAREILRQGIVVSGASRIRWSPIEASPEEIAGAFAAFPDPEPGRAFDASKCVRAALEGGRAVIELPREAASRKRWFRRQSFWETLMETASRLPLKYQHYSYGDRADVYRGELPWEPARILRERAWMLCYASLEMQVREYAYDRIGLWVAR